MSRSVHSVSSPGHHGPATVGQARAQGGRHMCAVVRASLEPTIATDRSAHKRRFALPRTHRPIGLPSSKSSNCRGHSSSPGHTNRPPSAVIAARSSVGLSTTSNRVARRRSPSNFSADTPVGISRSPTRDCTRCTGVVRPSHRPTVSSPGSTMRVNAARAFLSSSPTSRMCFPSLAGRREVHVPPHVPAPFRWRSHASRAALCSRKR